MDQISIEFLERNLFSAKIDGHLLQEDYKIVGIKVPFQLGSQEEFKSIVSLGNSAFNGLLISLIIPFCFMIFMSVSMNKVWSLYNLL